MNGCCLHHCRNLQPFTVDEAWKGWDWYGLSHPGIVEDDYSMASVDHKKVGFYESENIASKASNLAMKRIQLHRWADRATLHKIKDLSPNTIKRGHASTGERKLRKAIFEVHAHKQMKNFTWPPLPPMPKKTVHIVIPNMQHHSGSAAVDCTSCSRCHEGSYYAGHNRCCPTCFLLNTSDPLLRCYRKEGAKCTTPNKVAKASITKQFNSLRRHIDRQVRSLKKKLRS
jgi:hypothetical protein